MNKKNNKKLYTTLKQIINIILMFMYIFSFKVISIIDSTIVVGILLFLYFIFNKKYRDLCFKNIFSKNNFKIYIMFFLIVLLSFITSYVNKNYDLNYIKTLFHLLIVMVIGLSLISYYDLNEDKKNIIKYILLAFIIQSIFQWFFFIFPNISELFNYFRSESMIESADQYNGFRGIALSQSGFFSLASAYAVVLILYFTKYNTITHNKKLKIVLFLLLFSGVFFSGRTGYVGLIFIPFLLYKKGTKIFTKKNLINFGKTILILSVICIVFFLFTKDNSRFKSMYNHTFEIVLNIIKGEGIATSSTDNLLNMYKIDFSETNLLIGDAKYLVSENDKVVYYKKTDIGYYRKVLYFGIIGLLLSIMLQYYIINIKNKKDKKLLILIYLLLLILELKGEIIGFNLMVNSVLLLCSYNFDLIGDGEKC